MLRCLLNYTAVVKLQTYISPLQDFMRSGDTIWCHRTLSSLVQAMVCHLIGAKLLPEPMLTCFRLDP